MAALPGAVVHWRGLARTIAEAQALSEKSPRNPGMVRTGRGPWPAGRPPAKTVAGQPPSRNSCVDAQETLNDFKAGAACARPRRRGDRRFGRGPKASVTNLPPHSRLVGRRHDLARGNFPESKARAEPTRFSSATESCAPTPAMLHRNSGLCRRPPGPEGRSFRRRAGGFRALEGQIRKLS